MQDSPCPSKSDHWVATKLRECSRSSSAFAFKCDQDDVEEAPVA